MVFYFQLKEGNFRIKSVHEFEDGGCHLETGGVWEEFGCWFALSRKMEGMFETRHARTAGGFDEPLRGGT